VPTGATSFSGLLTGGNGREVGLGETFYYQLDVKAGQPELNAAIQLGGDPNNTLGAWLVDPSGDAVAYASNSLLTATPSGFTDVSGAQLHALTPAAGRWTLIIDYAPQVSGTALSEPFSVSIDNTPVSATSATLPDAASTKLAAGKSFTYIVKVTNSGPSPEVDFLDARSSSSTLYSLVGLNPPSVVEPVSVFSNIPAYLVPTDTSAVTMYANTTGAAPIQFDSEYASGDPDIASGVGTSVNAAYSANPVAQGIWSIVPVEAGPFGPAPGAAETVNTAMTAMTNSFDLGVTSTTGDLWQAGVADTAASSFFDPVEIDPGLKVSIPVTITPSGPAGTVVSGTLYVDDSDFLLYNTFEEPNGNQVAAIPYEYTIK
jgi:hypothetical protein